jgi:hypothetical protein
MAERYRTDVNTIIRQGSIKGDICPEELRDHHLFKNDAAP